MSAEDAGRATEEPQNRELPRASANESDAEGVSVHYDTRLPELPWSRRAQIPLIAAVVYTAIRLLGPTLRYEVLGWQHAERVHASGKRCIWAFWHRVIRGRRRGRCSVVTSLLCFARCFLCAHRRIV